MMQKRLNATIHGRVQGVSFRYYTKRQADRLHLTGWVRNQRNRSVQTTAEGDMNHLKQFAQWLQTGSPAAKVTQVDLNWSDATGEFRRFSVKWL